MSPIREPAIRVCVAPTNPGQFFACCGLLELAERLWDGAEGWFTDGAFYLRPLATDPSIESTLDGLLRAIADAALRQIDPDDDYSSPIEVPTPFGIRLDWWMDDRAGGDRLKVWAGSMRSVRIARAMQKVLQRPELQNDAVFDYGTVVYDPLESDKKVEPFYFDARRGSSAQAIDIGFAPDSFQMKTAAYPAVEFLCLVGLQRFRPMPTGMRRVFEYHTWAPPLATHIAPSAVCGLLPRIETHRFRFENAFRTDQRKHKAFTPATLLQGANDERSLEEF